MLITEHIFNRPHFILNDGFTHEKLQNRVMYAIYSCLTSKLETKTHHLGKPSVC